jgi:hypothetical protein
MKRVLYYGRAEKNIPWYDGFNISADGSIDFRLSGVETFEFNADQEILWVDIFKSKLDKLVSYQEKVEIDCSNEGHPFAVYGKYIERLFDMLKPYCNSESQAEKDFFNLYCDLSCCDFHGGALLPALIPHVYINWDHSQEERNKKKKPYIVDFVFKSSRFETSSLVIVEIDGFSHYATYDPVIRENIASEALYAEHLEKDRWLRKQGFKVFRIGNAEIKNIMLLPEEKRLKEFYSFFKEVFGNIPHFYL